MTAITQPLTREQLVSLADTEGWIEVDVKVHLSEIIDNDLEGFLDILCERVGASMLTDINYSIAGHEADDLTITVTGSLEYELED